MRVCDRPCVRLCNVHTRTCKDHTLSCHVRLPFPYVMTIGAYVMSICADVIIHLCNDHTRLRNVLPTYVMAIPTYVRTTRAVRHMSRQHRSFPLVVDLLQALTIDLFVLLYSRCWVHCGITTWHRWPCHFATCSYVIPWQASPCSHHHRQPK